MLYNQELLFQEKTANLLQKFFKILSDVPLFFMSFIFDRVTFSYILQLIKQSRVFSIYFAIL